MVAVLTTACAPDDNAAVVQPVDGVISLYETGEPIPDAFVVAFWTGTAGGLGHSGGAICFHVELTKTDGQWRYHFPVPETVPSTPTTASHRSCCWSLSRVIGGHRK